MYKVVKRILDFVGALLLILILTPIYLLLIIVLSFYYKGNPFFSQARPGLNNKVFKVFKFKSMTDAKDANGVLLSNKERITSVGKFIRKTSLDEIPQLFNVLKGDMSFIGPRPLLVDYLFFYTDKELKRHSVRPGITGLAQVNGRNMLEWDKRLELDVYYAENISFFMDCKIVLSTIKKVIKSSDISVVPNMPLLSKVRIKQREDI
ncbi:sugar transferase [Myroides odoratimimus]|uniref:sugar transferase n=1 Tax=Myroides odoratimimus TaxID=76832 RepID=UPI0025791805|nr:sugar transferase [Myroides odoratimimus]MDM1465218.1 sugar transferase [Myroides odoratimimus]MDM1475238.1 sugar transferase [Myroides odoratimimus]MDM1485071.1 sugar transferase [Myroides odoratimimus]